MALTINSNISALSAQGSLRSNGLKSSQSMERLSTGIRINSAKDDAAGLAISARMTAKLRGISGAVRNAHDGLSILETAEGGLNSISNAVQRMRELAVQSANSTNNSNDRASLNLEAKQLSSEIDRVASSTKFNGIKLLDGSFQNKPFQIGPDSSANDSISISIDSAKISSLGFGASTRTVSISSGQGTASPLAAGDLVINGHLVSGSQSDGVSFSASNASGIAKANAINAVSGVTGVVAKTEPTTISGSLITDTSTIINSGDIKINGVNIGAIGPAGSAIVRSSQIAAAINATSAQTGVTAKYTLDGKVSLTAIDGRNITVDTALSSTITGLGSAGTTRSTLTLTTSKPEGITIANLNVGASVVGLNSGVYLLTTNPSPPTTYTASTSGNTVGSTSLNIGDLSINGGAISAVPSPSAKDISEAINRITTSTGVSAVARPTVADSISISIPSTPASVTPGAVSVSVSPTTVSESGTTNLNYTFTRSGDASSALTVNLDIGGTATIADYSTSPTLASASEPIKGWTRFQNNGTDIIPTGMTTGLDGSIYVCGNTRESMDGQTYSDGGDAYVTKYASDGTKIWTRLVGGTGPDEAAALTTGLDGSIYLTGRTTNFLDGPNALFGGDAFVTKFAPDGTKLWTRVQGTREAEYSFALTTGLDGSIYMSGYTFGSFDGQTNSGSYDAFVTKYAPDGSKVWTRLLGSSANEEARSLTTGLDGSIYVCGFTQGSLDGQTLSGGFDSFVTKYGSDGTKLWTRLLGGSYGDDAQALTTGLDGAIYVSGTTAGSIDGQAYSGGIQDAFITKYSPDGTKVWTRLLGSNSGEASVALTTGLDGSIYMSGYTDGSLDGQTNSGSYDAFVTKYSPDGTRVWTRLLGSSGSEISTALTTGLDGSIYLSGSTNDAGFSNYWGNTNDSFLTKFSVSPQITFAAGESTATLVVSPTPDGFTESSETLIVTVLPGSGYSGGTSTATGSIIDGSAAAYSFNAIGNGDIQINGVSIGAIATATTSSERATQMLAAINTQTLNTSVVASLNTTTGGITLSAADGRNIELSTLTSANISGSAIGIALNGTSSGSRTITTFRSGVDLTTTSANGLSIVATGNGATASGLSTSTIAATLTTTPENNLISSQSASSELDLSTADSSKAAITLLDTALNKISNARATLGAFQNRLIAAIQNLETTSMNLAASRSRILDTNYAIETTNLAKAQIIQQASMAMLAQANQSNQSVLALLKS